MNWAQAKAIVQPQGVVITANALLTQREFARHLVEDRHAHYRFPVKANQKTLQDEVSYLFKQEKGAPNAYETNLGMVELNRKQNNLGHNKADRLSAVPLCGSGLCYRADGNKYKTVHVSREIAYGVTSQSRYDAKPLDVLRANRGHWCIENSCHYVLDWNYDENRCWVKSECGPENISRIRRFVISAVKATGPKGVAETMGYLVMNTRLVFDYLKTTKNSCGYAVSG